MVKVEVFSSPGCAKCAQAKTVLKAVAAELGPDKVSWREVNILEEIDYAVELGVMATPAIAINGKLIFVALPSAAKLRGELLNRLG
jgi:thioredoxin 1